MGLLMGLGKGLIGAWDGSFIGDWDGSFIGFSLYK